MDQLFSQLMRLRFPTASAIPTAPLPSSPTSSGVVTPDIKSEVLLERDAQLYYTFPGPDGKSETKAENLLLATRESRRYISVQLFATQPDDPLAVHVEYRALCVRHRPIHILQRLIKTDYEAQFNFKRIVSVMVLGDCGDVDPSPTPPSQTIQTPHTYTVHATGACSRNGTNAVGHRTIKVVGPHEHYWGTQAFCDAVRDELHKAESNQWSWIVTFVERECLHNPLLSVVPIPTAASALEHYDELLAFTTKRCTELKMHTQLDLDEPVLMGLIDFGRTVCEVLGSDKKENDDAFLVELTKRCASVTKLAFTVCKGINLGLLVRLLSGMVVPFSDSGYYLKQFRKILCRKMYACLYVDLTRYIDSVTEHLIDGFVEYMVKSKDPASLL